MRAARLLVPSKDPAPDPETGTLNARAIAAWSPKLADEFRVVLGGDCTIVLGSMFAFRRRGRCGLFFIDGNADFFQPEAEPMHLDADCLDDAIMPTLDFRVPGGSWDELTTALRVAMASGKAAGIEITI